MAAGYFCNRAGFLAWLFIVGGMLGTDVIDGPLARGLKAETKFGENADWICDLLANYILVFGWYFYTQKHFEFAQEYFNWRLMIVYNIIAFIAGIFILINPTGLKLVSGVKRWFTEDKGDFVVGVSVAGAIILWIAFHISWTAVILTVLSALVGHAINREKVSGFVRSAFHLKGGA